MNESYVNLPRKQKEIDWKNLIDKIHKLIAKQLKLNVNRHIKIDKNHNRLQV